MGKYNFDEIIQRRGTDSFKWDGTEEYYGSNDCIAMWTADMDFFCAEPIAKALKKRAEYPLYGYTLRSKEFIESVRMWLKKRHRCDVPEEWLAFAPPGVIYAIYTMMNIITEKGDSIMIHMPNYDPLFDMVEKSGRKLVKCPLLLSNMKFEIDFVQMEKMLESERPKALIISSPHNPTGRIWTKEELDSIVALCIKYDVYMLVDEIHADFVSKDKGHIAFANLGEEAAHKAMICYSANKGFNLGGLQMSTLVIADEEKRQLFNQQMMIAQTRLDTSFGLVATQTAYSDPECEEWLDEAIAYVDDNKKFVDKYLKEKIPQIKVIPTEGTYLVWLDCKGLGLKGKELEQFMVQEAKVAFCGGYEFGEEGEYFVRMTAAVSRNLIERALDQVCDAVKRRLT